MRLLSVSLPRVHPNILGPGLAQFPGLDISGSVMTDQQQGTVFFSILDTRKVRRLSLENCDLRPVNFVILATSVSCVERANLSRVRLSQTEPIFTFKSSLFFLNLVEAAARTTRGNPKKMSAEQNFEVFPDRASSRPSIYYWK